MLCFKKRGFESCCLTSIKRPDQLSLFVAWKLPKMLWKLESAKSMNKKNKVIFLGGKKSAFCLCKLDSHPAHSVANFTTPPTVQLLDVVWLEPGSCDDQTTVLLFQIYKDLCFHRFSSQQAVLVFLQAKKICQILYGCFQK